MSSKVSSENLILTQSAIEDEITIAAADAEAAVATVVDKQKEKENNNKNEVVRPNNLIDLLKRIKEINLQDTCPICLLSINHDSRSYTNTCFHCFCFDCLFEWSKIKANCPLCKQQFKHIYFDIKSLNNYKEFKIKPSNSSSSTTTITSSTPTPLLSTLSQSLTLANAFFNLNQSHRLLPRIFSFEINGNISSSFLTRFYGLPQTQWYVNKQDAPEKFRLNVYINKLYASPNEIELLNDEQIEGSNNTNDRTTSIVKPARCRETSAKFYRHNDACTHRLLPFLKREIDAIRKHFIIQPKYLLTDELTIIIKGFLKKYDINSSQFLNAIQNHIKPITIARHFQHEFFVYARSFAHTVAEYDAKCVYYSSNFTKRVDMSLYRKYEYLNIISTHVQTLPPQLTGDVDELLKSFAENNEVIKIDDDEDDDIEIVSIEQNNNNNNNDEATTTSTTTTLYNNNNDRNPNASEVIIIPVSHMESTSNSSTTISSNSSNNATSSSEIHSIDSSSNSNTSSYYRSSDDFPIYDDDNDDDNDDIILSSSTFSETEDHDNNSSYCEEISEPTKTSPDCIYLSSDEDERPTTSKRKRSMSNLSTTNSNDSNKPKTSNYANKKWKTKNGINHSKNVNMTPTRNNNLSDSE